MWEAFTGANIVTYRGHTRFVRAIAWSPDGTHIASGGDYGDSTVQVWDAFNSKHVYTRNQQYRIFAVAWSGERIASGSFDGSVQIWDWYTGDTIFIYRGHSAPVYTAAWSPNGAYIASGGHDKTIQVWEAPTGKNVCTYKGHTNAVKSLAWSPDSKYIASGGDDMTVKVWEMATGKNITSYNGYTEWVRSVAWSPAGNYIASASGRMVKIWQPFL